MAEYAFTDDEFEHHAVCKEAFKEKTKRYKEKRIKKRRIGMNRKAWEGKGENFILNLFLIIHFL